MLTVTEAARATGWSARMLRYVEALGLLAPERSTGGYRLYGPAQLQRLGSLRALLERYGVGLAEVSFAARLHAEPALRRALEVWFAEATRRPIALVSSDWLRFEQDKHERLLAVLPDRHLLKEPA